MSHNWKKELQHVSRLLVAVSFVWYLTTISDVQDSAANLRRETDRAREIALLVQHARGTVPPAMVFKSQICLVFETSKTPDGPWAQQGTENCDTSYAILRAR